MLKAKKLVLKMSKSSVCLSVSVKYPHKVRILESFRAVFIIDGNIIGDDRDLDERFDITRSYPPPSSTLPNPTLTLSRFRR